MSEQLCELKKKGGGSDNTAPDEFYIFNRENTTVEGSAAVFFDYDKVFPKYSKVKYEIINGAVSKVQLDNMPSYSATPTTMNITTSWQNIPSSIKSGSGYIRFLISSVNQANTRVMVKIYLAE